MTTEMEPISSVNGAQVITVGEEAEAVEITGTGLHGFFARIAPDASPGNNTLTITGLPPGTRYITVWMTEWQNGQPHAGGAFFYTSSVQLYDNGRKCRVIYRLDWNRHLPAAAQVIYG